MTKKDLLQKIDTWGVDDIAITGIKDCVKQFFDSNVCIPKGENRHEYADVLHEWVEDTSKQLEWFNNNYQDTSLHEWVIMPDRLIYIDKKMRIKPSEPVYEWQWLVVHHQAYVVSDHGRFMTLEETCDGMMPIEETKRVRQ